MVNKFDWKEFFRIAGGVFFIGLGGSIVATSTGSLGILLAGFASVAIGLAILFTG